MTNGNPEPELRRDREAAAQMAANALMRYRHQANAQGEREKQDWMAKVLDTVRAKQPLQ